MRCGFGPPFTAGRCTFKLPPTMGTKASMGFAIRLSMAAHFLDGMDGFLILDDPMVDMDPERRNLTADVLNEFACNKQVIVFTCHQAHADLLTPSPIHLSRTPI